MSVKNVISVSGGKDSTAMMLLAYEQGVEPDLVFADTGHEHPMTYGYVAQLNDWCKKNWGREIHVVRADFSSKFQARRAFIRKKWPEDGVPAERVERAIKAMHSTGNPFLDLCKLKGRFPSTRVRFCTVELKHKPINEHIETLMVDADALISWQGIRADESPSRALLPMRDVECGSWEPEPVGHLIYRPLLHWSAQQVFDQHRKHGMEPNPLYKLGMGRVGCMPCIMARKSEIAEIAARFPDQVDRLEQWERDVTNSAKLGGASFFASDKTPEGRSLEGDELKTRSIGIREIVEWSQGNKDPHQVGLFADEEELPSCSSVYGLCE